ncbi:hypothetical protein JCM3765_000486 [Sporobolomyces pararoseus]
MSQQRTKIPICFDVLGTCFSFDSSTKALLSVFPNLNKDYADSIISDWFHSAQRDFTYLSMNGDYKPIAQVLKSTLPRIYLMHNLVPIPSSTTSSAMTETTAVVDQKLLNPVFESLSKMIPRPSLKTCIQTLHDSSNVRFKFLAVTNGGLESTKNYFYQAFNDNDNNQEEARELVDQVFKWSFLSCDELKIAKPDRKIYENVWNKLKEEEDQEGLIIDKDKREGWFVASHTWDLHAAKKSGFKTAFVTYEEHLILPELFGKPDLIGKDLEEIAKKIIEFEESR